jgi:PAS domain S-box-containing protein
VAETVNMSHPAEQSGEADAERALAVAAAAPALSWSASRAQTNDWLSPSWSTYTGQPVSELRGEGWTRFVHPEDLERCLGIRATSFEAQSPFTLDLRLRRHDGEYRWFVDNGAVLRGGDSAPAGFVGSAIEIHERKMLEETLADRTQALRLAERRQGSSWRCSRTNCAIRWRRSPTPPACCAPSSTATRSWSGCGRSWNARSAGSAGWWRN